MGGEYHYFDADETDFVRSDKDITKNNGDAIGATLESMYNSKKSDNDAYGMWNDQPTKEKAAGSIYAHSKGVFHADTKQGWYMIHSMPAFPNAHDLGYDMLSSETYGQTFMCLTMKTEEFDKLGEDLQTMKVFFYDDKFSEGMQEAVPNLVDAADKVENKEVQTKSTVFTTIGGQEMTHFAKGRYWGKGLYEDLVAEELDSDIASETWQNGSKDNVIPTFCPPGHNHTIANVLTLKFGDDEWTETKDHAKWAITTDGFDQDTSKHASACIGGINRQFSQAKRGGATMCIENKDLNSALFNAIVDFEDCEGSR
jgi:deoxyribonuclease-2